MSATTRDKLTKHTPGPWRYYVADGDRHIDSADLGFSMCDTDYYPWCRGNDADWRLIAAAPELLAALQSFIAASEAVAAQWNADGTMQDAERMVGSVMDNEAVENVAKLAKRAIAKALGTEGDR
jgi:hypothetical protein